MSLITALFRKHVRHLDSFFLLFQKINVKTTVVIKNVIELSSNKTWEGSQVFQIKLCGTWFLKELLQKDFSVNLRIFFWRVCL